ncbi:MULTISPECIES: hypothetical protein [unclassified Corynebacterium]|uniref:hypothetical protein n=1 Tax=unclassified Corynebacterium TaxID=2624378 RepID=UPI00264E58F2|nr:MULTISPECIES: hypothetical protein [unclassified Corynebacterium]MDN8594026.1 hypothetical protein [Corynebacterium sp. P4_F2]WKK54917.1 hypothetical protein QYR03_06675 [Corynebacterium sp. P4-C1]
MTNGTHPTPQQGFGQGWPQAPGPSGPVPQFPPQAYPGQPGMPGQQTAGPGDNQFGGARPFQQAEHNDPAQISTDEAENIAAQRGEKVQQTEERRSRIWSKILGVIGLALLIAFIAVIAWTYLPEPSTDTTAAPALLTQITFDAPGTAPAQYL